MSRESSENKTNNMPQKSSGKLLKLTKNPMINATIIIIPALIIAGIVILLATLLNRSFSQQGEGETEYIAVAAPSDKPLKVELPDGSIVWLRSSSTMEYAKDFTALREVLIVGEANFNVAKYNDMPFTVKNGNVSVSVLGTQFNVRFYPESAESSVALIEGKVEVNMPSGNVILEPSEQITYNKETGESKIEVIDVETLNFWLEDHLVIDEQPLHQAISQICDFYEMSYEQTAPTLPLTKISIIIHRTDSIREILNVLEVLEPSVSYTVEGETIKVFGR